MSQVSSPAPAGTKPVKSVKLVAPTTGTTQKVESAAGSQVKFDFDQSKASFERTGTDLNVKVDGGGTIVMEKFFAVGKEALPTFVLPDGTEVPSAALLKQLDPKFDVSTAAGPGSSSASASGGSGDYEDGGGDLIGGLDRLGSLGTHYWSGGINTYEEPVSAEFTVPSLDAPVAPVPVVAPAPAPEFRPAPIVTVPTIDFPGTPGVEGSGGSGDSGGPSKPVAPGTNTSSPVLTPNSGITMSEANLANGSSPNAGALTQTGAFLLDNNGETLTLTLTDSNNTPHPIVISPEGVITSGLGTAIDTGCGIMTVTGAHLTPEGKVEVEYTYTLTDPANNGPSGEVATDNIPLTVTDESGDSASAVLQINIADDTPIAKNDANTAGDFGAANTISGNVVAGDPNGGVADVFGADGMPASPVTGVMAGTTGTPSPAGVGAPITGAFGTLTLNPDGSYTYAQTGMMPKDATDVFTYQITDGDGDVQTATITMYAPGSGGPTDPNGPDPVPATPTMTITSPPAVDESKLTDNDPSTVPTTTGSLVIDGNGEMITLEVTDKDGVVHPVTFNPDGTIATGGGTPIETDHGILTVTGATLNPETGEVTVDYEFEQTGPANHPDPNATGPDDVVTDIIPVAVVDSTGDRTPAGNIEIPINDDAPIANADAGKAQGIAVAVTGNVVTGAGDAINPALAADYIGADANTSPVTGVVAGTGAPVTGTGVGTPISGVFGNITINPDGSYSYVQTGLMAADATDVFTYQVTDADGDVKTATITIYAPGAGTNPVDPTDPTNPDPDPATPTMVITPPPAVNEALLADNDPTTVPTTTGTLVIDGNGEMITLEITDKDGIVHPVTFNPDGTIATGGDTPIETGHGIITVTGATLDPVTGEVTVDYEFEQTSPGNHPDPNATGPDDVVTDIIPVAVVDSTGDRTPAGNIEIPINDDAPIANADAGKAQGIAVAVTGNVVTGAGDAIDPALAADYIGADATATPVTGVVAGTGVPVAGTGVGTAVTGVFGNITINPDGSYSYVQTGLMTADATDVFTYQVTDADGDVKTATITIYAPGAGTNPVDPTDPTNPDPDPATPTMVITPPPAVNEALLADNDPTTVPTTTGTLVIDGNGEMITLEITDKDGIVHPVTFNPDGTIATGGDTPIETGHGIITVTGATLDPVTGEVTVDYEFEQTSPANHPDPNATGPDDVVTDIIPVAVVDSTGDRTPAGNIEIPINDDAPIANADAGKAQGIAVAVTGNVVTGIGDAIDPALAADYIGADANTSPVTGVVAGSGAPVTGTGVGTVVTGTYGNITINADGSYSYTQTGMMGLTDTDVFTYQVTDGDGDIKTATITIYAPGATPTNPTDPTDPIDPAVPTISALAPAAVDEALLADNDPTTVPTTNGTIVLDGNGEMITLEITDKDGNPVAVTFNPDGTVLSGGNVAIPTDHGTITVTGSTLNPVTGEVTVEYTYELTDPATHTDPNAVGAADISTEIIPVKVIDSTGDEAMATISIDILDDGLTANPDTNQTQGIGAANQLTGNVVTGAANGVIDAAAADYIGADATATPVTGVVAGTGAPATGTGVGTVVTGTYGNITINADGSYTYDQTGLMATTDTDVFTYQVTDADGDVKTATITIYAPASGGTPTVPDPTTPVNPTLTVPAGPTLDEDDLAAGTSPDAPALTKTGAFTLQSNGEQFTLVVTDKDNVEHTLTFNTNGTIASGNTVIDTDHGTLTLTGSSLATDGTITVNYSYVLDERAEHPLAGAFDVNDTVTDTIGLKVIDSDGGIATGNLVVTILDDAPTAIADAAVHTLDLHDIDNDGVQFTGNLEFNFGADGRSTTGDFINFIAPAGLTSQGAAITYEDDGQGNLLAIAGGVLVFELHLDPDTGDYTFTQHTIVDGVVDVDGVVKDLNFGVTFTDSDGDPTQLDNAIKVKTVYQPFENKQCNDRFVMYTGVNAADINGKTIVGNVTFNDAGGSAKNTLLSVTEGVYGKATINAMTGEVTYTLIAAAAAKMVAGDGPIRDYVMYTAKDEFGAEFTKTIEIVIARKNETSELFVSPNEIVGETHQNYITSIGDVIDTIDNKPNTGTIEMQATTNVDIYKIGGEISKTVLNLLTGNDTLKTVDAAGAYGLKSGIVLNESTVNMGDGEDLVVIGSSDAAAMNLSTLIAGAGQDSVTITGNALGSIIALGNNTTDADNSLTEHNILNINGTLGTTVVYEADGVTVKERVFSSVYGTDGVDEITIIGAAGQNAVTDKGLIKTGAADDIIRLIGGSGGMAYAAGNYGWQGGIDTGTGSDTVLLNVLPDGTFQTGTYWGMFGLKLISNADNIGDYLSVYGDPLAVHSGGFHFGGGDDTLRMESLTGAGAVYSTIALGGGHDDLRSVTRDSTSVSDSTITAGALPTDTSVAGWIAAAAQDTVGDTYFLKGGGYGIVRTKLYAGAGDDTITIESGTAPAVVQSIVHLGAGEDTIKVNSSAHSGMDAFSVIDGTADDKADLYEITAKSYGMFSNAKILAGGGHDTIRVTSSAGTGVQSSSIHTGEGTNLVEIQGSYAGTAAANITAGTGNDTISIKATAAISSGMGSRSVLNETGGDNTITIDAMRYGMHNSFANISGAGRTTMHVITHNTVGGFNAAPEGIALASSHIDASAALDGITLTLEGNYAMHAGARTTADKEPDGVTMKPDHATIVGGSKAGDLTGDSITMLGHVGVNAEAGEFPHNFITTGQGNDVLTVMGNMHNYGGFAHAAVTERANWVDMSAGDDAIIVGKTGTGWDSVNQTATWSTDATARTIGGTSFTGGVGADTIVLDGKVDAVTISTGLIDSAMGDSATNYVSINGDLSRSIIYGSDGIDHVTVNGAVTRTAFHGGTGVDQLHFDGAGALVGAAQTLKFSDLLGGGGSMDGFEVLDLKGTHTNLLQVNTNVASVTGLRINGDGVDTVELATVTNWSAGATVTHDSINYVTYTTADSTQQLLIQQGVTVNFV